MRPLTSSAMMTTGCLAGVLLSGHSVDAAFTGFEGSMTSVQITGQDRDVWRVYALFDNPADTLISVTGNAPNPVLIVTPGGFYQDGVFGNDVEPNPAFFPLFPELEYDTHVTIGGYTGQQPTSLLANWPGFSVDELFVDNSGWLRTPGEPGTIPALTPGGNLGVLIGQFTVFANAPLLGEVTLTLGDSTSVPTSFIFGPCVATSACCIDAETCIFVCEESECDLAGGTFLGVDSECSGQTLSVDITEPGGSIFTHVLGTTLICPPPGGGLAGGCQDGPKIDPWRSPADGQMCHNFGVPGSPAIPAGFFGPGSDPFASSICLEGVSLGPVSVGGFKGVDFGNADTLIQRSADPFDRCELPKAFPATSTVDIEIVALSLRSVSPIVVTENGGQNPQQWSVDVDLSVVPSPPGNLTATKTHCNGGTYTSTLFVQPRFTFENIDDPGDIRVLDTGLEGTAPVMLDATAQTQPWVHDLDAIATQNPFCTAFHAGIDESAKTVDCDCNNNGIRDRCDIEEATSVDCDADALPDECQLGPCAADVVSSGTVDVDDLVEVILHWGEGPCAGGADIDRNGNVNVDDLLATIINWGPCPTDG